MVKQSLFRFANCLEKRCFANLVFLSFFIICAVFTNAAYSQTNETLEAGCDPNFMFTLNKKAEMEALRDVAMAQTHIKKPDSVFQLTCFDNMLTNSLAVAQFPSSVDASIREGQLSAVLNVTIGNIVREHLNSNFDHTILGGYPLSPATANHKFIEVRDTASSHNCAQMSIVWNMAKCINFDDSDFYYDTDNVITDPIGDPMPYSVFTDIDDIDADQPAPGDGASRTSFGQTRLEAKPVSCAASPSGMASTNEWLAMAEIAFNEEDTIYDFRAFLDPGIPVDPAQYPTYDSNLTSEPWFTLTLDKSTAGGCQGGQGILTGLVYNRNGRQCDGFCPNPGCTYTPTSIGANEPASACTPGSCG